MKVSRHAAISLLSANIDHINALVLNKGSDRSRSTLQPNGVNRRSTPIPIVVSASQRWEGNDGSWSTFEIQIGNAQNVRLLPSTASSVTSVIIGEGNCAFGATANCTDLHGGVFDWQKSNTWEPLANTSLRVDDFVNKTVQANFGFEKIKLSAPVAEVAVVNKALIAGVPGTNLTWFGTLGLNPRPINILNSINSAQVSMVQGMKDQGLIPSLSWAYTTGAGSEIELLSVGIDTFALIDSTTPYFRLPESYILNASQHQSLLTLDPRVTFVLSPTLPPSAANKTVSITLPYAAFDLNKNSPDGKKEEQFYFPLKRTINGSQITLGRAFLQEAYLVADYERHNFSVWPVNWDWAQDKSQVIPISSPAGGDSKQVHKSLSKAAIAGISVGISTIAIAIALTLTLFFRNRHQTCASSSIKELPGDSEFELPEQHRFECPEGGKFELNGICRPLEADSQPVAYEMDAGRDGVVENSARSVAELSEQTTLKAGGAPKYGTNGRRSRSSARSEERSIESEKGGEYCEHSKKAKNAMSFTEFSKITPKSHS
ncbi:aspartic peptidase domain-containing protein [Phaeosphaeriaceae sp. PMI808]|nr:aspartic peptidase domain-containing protein [Phaeosphaeriaceae sp. PMI808]